MVKHLSIFMRALACLNMLHTTILVRHTKYHPVNGCTIYRYPYTIYIYPQRMLTLSSIVTKYLHPGPARCNCYVAYGIK